MWAAPALPLSRRCSPYPSASLRLFAHEAGKSTGSTGSVSHTSAPPSGRLDATALPCERWRSPPRSRGPGRCLRAAAAVRATEALERRVDEVGRKPGPSSLTCSSTWPFDACAERRTVPPPCAGRCQPCCRAPAAAARVGGQAQAVGRLGDERAVGLAAADRRTAPSRPRARRPLDGGQPDRKLALVGAGDHQQVLGELDEPIGLLDSGPERRLKLFHRAAPLKASSSSVFSTASGCAARGLRPTTKRALTLEGAPRAAPASRSACYPSGRSRRSAVEREALPRPDAWRSRPRCRRIRSTGRAPGGHDQYPASDASSRATGPPISSEGAEVPRASLRSASVVATTTISFRSRLAPESPADGPRLAPPRSGVAGYDDCSHARGRALRGVRTDASDESATTNRPRVPRASRIWAKRSSCSESLVRRLARLEPDCLDQRRDLVGARAQAWSIDWLELGLKRR